MIQNGFRVKIIEAEKVEVDELAHKLPDGIRELVEYRVKDYHCPEDWSRDGSFIPVTEDMPLWFDFRTNDECACLVSIQKVNPITGKPANLEEGLSNNPIQNYLWLPEQKWLDGYGKEGKVYQFRVTKQGESLAINEFVLPPAQQDSHVLAFAFFRLKVEKKPYNRSMPNWYSPLHTPQNWNIPNTRYLKNKTVVTPCYSLPGYKQNTTDNTNSNWHFNNTVFGQNQLISGESMTRGCVGGGGTQSAALSNQSVEPAIASSDLDYSAEEIPTYFHDSLNELNDASMGAGGRIEQRIISDPNSIDFYEAKPTATLLIYMALPELFNKIMEAGEKQNPNKKDKYVHSGQLQTGTIVPLIK